MGVKINKEDVIYSHSTATSDLVKYPVKDSLYGKQKGNCAGCKLHFLYWNLWEDYIVPLREGGGSDIENMQLLCGHCKGLKGEGNMDVYRKRLAERTFGFV